MNHLEKRGVLEAEFAAVTQFLIAQSTPTFIELASELQDLHRKMMNKRQGKDGVETVDSESSLNGDVSDTEWEEGRDTREPHCTDDQSKDLDEAFAGVLAADRSVQVLKAHISYERSQSVSQTAVRDREVFRRVPAPHAGAAILPATTAPAPSAAVTPVAAAATTTSTRSRSSLGLCNLVGVGYFSHRLKNHFMGIESLRFVSQVERFIRARFFNIGAGSRVAHAREAKMKLSNSRSLEIGST
jgi:hypothetical protein